MDGKFGVFCADGAFVQRPWPELEECITVPVCEEFLTPEDGTGYKNLGLDIVEAGQYVYYECNDPNAILDDDSCRNYFPLLCMDTNQWATVEFDSNGTELIFPVNETFMFPKCRSQCTQFYIGRKDFKALDDTIEVRAGDIAEFVCDFGHFVSSTQV